jgi:hypothetical protein
MNGLPVGALAWIIRTETGNESMLGRVVTVVSGLQSMPQRGGAFMHLIDAEWLRIERPRTLMFAPPSALKPIAGPIKEPVAPRELIPEAA